MSVGVSVGACECDKVALCVCETGEDGTNFHTPLGLETPSSHLKAFSRPPTGRPHGIAMQTHLSREGGLPCSLITTVGVVMTAAQPQREA